MRALLPRVILPSSTIGTGDGSDSGCLERLADNRMTGYLLLVYRIQHTLHGSLYILDCLVDHAVQTHIDFLAVRNGFRLSVRANVETDDDRIGSGCKCNIGLVDRANTAVDDLDNNFLVGKFSETLFYSLYRTLYIGFNDDRQLLDISGLDLGEQIV